MPLISPIPPCTSAVSVPVGKRGTAPRPTSPVGTGEARLHARGCPRHQSLYGEERGRGTVPACRRVRATERASVNTGQAETLLMLPSVGSRYS